MSGRGWIIFGIAMLAAGVLLAVGSQFEDVLLTVVAAGLAILGVGSIVTGARRQRN